MKRWQKMTVMLLLGLHLSLNGCATKNVYFTSDDRVYVIEKQEEFVVPWDDGAVVMSKGKFSQLFDEFLEGV